MKAINSTTPQTVKLKEREIASDAVNLIRKRAMNFWEKEGNVMALELFKNASRKVPAYKEFLKKNNIDVEKINSWSDFKKLPIINKKNYLKQYPFEKLCWNGNLKKPLVFTSTSGSTGEPFYFCRSEELDWQYSIMHELFLKNISSGKAIPTLVIVCFGMGVWIGGLITYQSFQLLGQRGYPLSIITPGINKEEIYKSLTNLAPHFKQTILVGYPPFIKDIVDEATQRNINVKELNIKLMFAAEAFTEKFRDYLSGKLGIKNPSMETMNIYGSADIGAMAFESPISILIRRIAVKNPELYADLFSNASKMPTLAQYIPDFITFESVNGEILLTGDSSIPLIRYSIGDHGGVFTYNEMIRKMEAHGINLEEEIEKAGIVNYKLPFVYVYERLDQSTTLYGLQIYPETIKEVLLEDSFNEILTGKFTLITKYNSNQDQYLEINLELQKDKVVTPVFETSLLKSIVDNLLLRNSEYKELYKFIGERAIPKLVFWHSESPNYFKPGIKQRWVEK